MISRSRGVLKNCTRVMTPSGHMGLDGYALILLSVGTKYEPKTGVALDGWRKYCPKRQTPHSKWVFRRSHLLVKVDLLYREIPGFNLARSNKYAICLPTLKIPFSLDPAHGRLSVNSWLRKGKRNTDDPSFFPIGSSYSTPTQTPGENLVSPTNLTVPRLWKPGSADSTWHLEPTWMLRSSSVLGGS